MNSGRGRVRGSTAERRIDLGGGWSVLPMAPDAATEPAALPVGASGPPGGGPAVAGAGGGETTGASAGTVAAALRAAGRWSLDAPARRFDAEDWWWRRTVDVPACAPDEEVVLWLGGLATLCDVFVDGRAVLSSESMFVEHELALVPGSTCEVVLRFRALDKALGARRPRPRWRAPMIENQQLRWFRTTLLGRTPGWSPPAAAVGPWRGVELVVRRRLAVEDVRVGARVDGDDGRLDVEGRLRGIGAAGDRTGWRARVLVQGPDGADVVITVDASVEVSGAGGAGGDMGGAVASSATRTMFRASVTIPGVTRWWPHTHGTPARYRVTLELDAGSGASADGAGDGNGTNAPERFDLGWVGFRDLRVDTAGGDFAVSVNGRAIFCRGACWTPVDPVTLASRRDQLTDTFRRVVDAGMNMLRVGGTMVYESDDFYDLCDEHGVLVWQDFMFANMDYPDDPGFSAQVDAEVDQVLARLQARPSLAVLCGSSEGEQQAAMWGASRELWAAPLFHQALPARARGLCPDVTYWPSSAHGGAFPHQPSAGTTSYYGVGAYLRPLEDARLSEVRFASECLAFANLPRDGALAGGPSGRVHQPLWKARTPRDLGAGWDFDDVRDHYVGRLFNVDPVQVRWSDHDRYVALGRVATGEVMRRTFAEWRRARAVCRGGLVWFLRDLWAGAGWGLLDATGQPKAAYWYARRALQPVAIAISDEGVNGLVVNVVAERPTAPGTDRGAGTTAAPAFELEIAVYSNGETPVDKARAPLALAVPGTAEVPVGALLDGFRDLSFAYRFGPPSCDLVVATLLADGQPVAEATHLPLGLSATRTGDLGLAADVTSDADGNPSVTVRTRRFAHAVHFDLPPGVEPADDFFDVTPGATRTIALRRTQPGAGGRGLLQALNATSTVAIVLPS